MKAVGEMIDNEVVKARGRPHEELSSRFANFLLPVKTHQAHMLRGKQRSLSATPLKLHLQPVCSPKISSGPLKIPFRQTCGTARQYGKLAVVASNMRVYLADLHALRTSMGSS